MCNIAGYAGTKQAAPILLEMVRKQQPFDGFCSCGIATIHEGKLHYRKILGTIDDLIEKTDALSLPGTVGIAHTRDGGMPDEYELAHPYLSMAEDMAVVSNGTTPNDHHAPHRDEMLQMLAKEGFQFRTARYKPDATWPKLEDGRVVGTAEVRVLLIEYYLKQGLSYMEALTKTASELFADNVMLMVNQNAGEKIFAARTVRPMGALLADGETYLATSPYGFPEDVEGEYLSLPLMRGCIITKDGIEITSHKVVGDEAEAISPRAYALAYQALEEALKNASEENPLTGFSSVVKRVEAEAFPAGLAYNERIRLSYETLDTFRKEGRLGQTIVQMPWKGGMRGRYAFWLK